MRNNMDKKVQACKAILKYKDKYILFLRDNKPTILFPAYWDCFGGCIEPNETIEECIKRELMEELNIELDTKYIETIAEDTVPIRYVAMFTISLTDEDIKKLQFMGEGQKYGFFTVDELVDMKVVPHFRRYFK